MRRDRAPPRARDLHARRRFFEAILDLRHGLRPAFGFPGHRMALPEIGERRVFPHAPGGAPIEVAFRERLPTARTQEAFP